MQLKAIEVSWFLRHEGTKRIEFKPGMNAIRGPNEAGKSSFLEGMAYCLFGASALEKTLEETLNRNAPKKNALKTKVEFSHKGRDYTVTRSATGAEILGRDPKPLCTGQNEVTLYIEGLLGLPHGQAANIMIAGQNEIRGVLGLGPTAAAAFIERLSDFSEIDKLIKWLGEVLPNGNTKLIESRIESIKANQVEHAAKILADPEEVKPEIEALTAQIARQEPEAKLLREQEQALRIANSQVGAQRQALAGEIRRLESSGVASALQIAALSSKSEGRAANEAELDQINQKLLQALEYDAYQKFLALPRPADMWEGDVASLDAEYETLSTRITDAKIAISAATAEIGNLRKRLITRTVCPTCGCQGRCDESSIGDAEATAKANAAIQVEIARNEKEAAALNLSMGEMEAERQILLQIKRAGEIVLNWARDNGARVEVNEFMVPAVLTWQGVTPVAVNCEGLASQAATLKRLIEEAASAPSRLAALTEAAEKDHARLTEVKAELAALPAVDEAKVAQLAEAAQILEVAVRQAQSRLATLREERVARVAAKEAFENRSAVLLRDLTEQEALLTEFRENNLLIKAVKDGRLLVNERLWNTVMAGVSNYFSRLRGVPSIVTRGPGGFLIDGHGGRLSGSTADVLGLALRIVVAKVFAPTGLLILDEPSSGCDQRRTASMTGVLAASGFEQVIIISHNDLTESLSELNLIELEAA
jgi:DNA repair exonuclease SbcCD ATPase subunit